MIHAESPINQLFFDGFRELCEREKYWPKAIDRTLKPSKLHDGPKTLVCHDMQGGYLAEDGLSPIEVASSEEKPFIFTHWWHIDTFIYFSHHFITVPTVRWINQCHDHNVLCLGTFITESAKGRELCAEIFASDINIDILIDHLVSLCEEFHFDGWLINVENVIDASLVGNLLSFLFKLKRELKNKIGEHAQLIWYDSVRMDGSLDWQNEMNESNVSFAEVVDAFYTNYAWNRDHLKRTRQYIQVEKTSIKATDIYFGVDIFGRGSFGGGQFNSHVAVQAARNYGFSVALFAPGWTTECFKDESCWILNHDKLFRSMSDTLYAHRLNRPFKTNFSVGQHENSKFDPSTRSIMPFLLESKGLQLTVENGLKIEGKQGSRHTLFLTDFRCVRSFKIDYTCPDKLMINAQVSESNENFVKTSLLKRVNIWQIYCVKLTDDPVFLNYISVDVQN